MSGFGDSLTTVGTTQLHPLGTTVVEPATQGGTRANQGEKTWIYVKNEESSAAFAVGTAVVRDPSAAGNDWYGGVLSPATAHAAQVLVLGVSQHAIAAGSYGFILRNGVGTVLAGSAALTLDTPFTTGGSAVGTVLDWADDTAGSTISVIGHSATAILGGATGTAYINCG